MLCYLECVPHDILNPMPGVVARFVVFKAMEEMLILYSDSFHHWISKFTQPQNYILVLVSLWHTPLRDSFEEKKNIIKLG